ncbi:MAG: hypothetical protein KAV87_55870, partial [Desulfobacteraceae bacterium]|nr:hypothetical protein [Desulfobacteraceae bacterium]
MDYYGYAGKILYVDLTSGDIEKQQLDTEVAQKFLGGWGINYQLEYDLLKPDTDPLSPDNPIIIGVGVLCGTLAPASSKCTVTMKLPICASKSEKKYIVATAVGGTRRFGAMIKNAGYDHVVITGRAKKPSYLKIIDDDVEICDASDLWGKKDVYETSDELAKRHRGATGPAGVWAIGKAAENLVRHAHGGVDMHAQFGRHGVAAVLGSKNLKAIVTLGTKGIKVADSARFMKAADRIRREIISHPLFHKGGIIKGLYPGVMGIRRACMACPDGCKFEYHVEDGRLAGERLKVSYRFVAFALGSRLGLKYYGDSVRLLNLVNDYGLD